MPKKKKSIDTIALVSHGKTEYPAYLIANAEEMPGMVYIRWQISGVYEYVPRESIIEITVQGEYEFLTPSEQHRDEQDADEIRRGHNADNKDDAEDDDMDADSNDDTKVKEKKKTRKDYDNSSNIEQVEKLSRSLKHPSVKHRLKTSTLMESSERAPSLEIVVVRTGIEDDGHMSEISEKEYDGSSLTKDEPGAKKHTNNRRKSASTLDSSVANTSRNPKNRKKRRYSIQHIAPTTTKKPKKSKVESSKIIVKCNRDCAEQNNGNNSEEEFDDCMQEGLARRQRVNSKKGVSRIKSFSAEVCSASKSEDHQSPFKTMTAKPTGVRPMEDSGRKCAKRGSNFGPKKSFNGSQAAADKENSRRWSVSSHQRETATDIAITTFATNKSCGDGTEKNMCCQIDKPEDVCAATSQLNGIDTGIGMSSSNNRDCQLGLMAKRHEETSGSRPGPSDPVHDAGKIVPTTNETSQAVEETDTFNDDRESTWSRHDKRTTLEVTDAPFNSTCQFEGESALSPENKTVSTEFVSAPVHSGDRELPKMAQLAPASVEMQPNAAVLVTAQSVTRQKPSSPLQAFPKTPSSGASLASFETQPALPQSAKTDARNPKQSTGLEYCSQDEEEDSQDGALDLSSPTFECAVAKTFTGSMPRSADSPEKTDSFQHVDLSENKENTTPSSKTQGTVARKQFESFTVSHKKDTAVGRQKQPLFELDSDASDSGVDSASPDMEAIKKNHIGRISAFPEPTSRRFSKEGTSDQLLLTLESESNDSDEERSPAGFPGNGNSRNRNGGHQAESFSSVLSVTKFIVLGADSSITTPSDIIEEVENRLTTYFSTSVRKQLKQFIVELKSNRRSSPSHSEDESMNQYEERKSPSGASHDQTVELFFEDRLSTTQSIIDSHYRSITKVSLYACARSEISTSHSAALFSALATLERLSDVSVFCNGGNLNMGQLMQIFTPHNSIRKLELVDAILVGRVEDFEPTRIQGSFQAFKGLHLVRCVASEESNRHAFEKWVLKILGFAPITQVWLEQCELSDDCIGKFGQNFQRFELLLRGMKLPHNILSLANLTKLSLVDCYDTCIQKIATSQVINLVMKELFLWNRMPQAVAIRFLQALQRNEAVEKLTMTVTGGSNVYRLGIATLLQVNLALRSIDIAILGQAQDVERGAASILKALETNRTIESVRLFVQKSDEIVANVKQTSISKVLRRNHTLRRLHLFGIDWSALP